MEGRKSEKVRDSDIVKERERMCVRVIERERNEQCEKEMKK